MKISTLPGKWHICPTCRKKIVIEWENKEPLRGADYHINCPHCNALLTIKIESILVISDGTYETADFKI